MDRSYKRAERVNVYESLNAMNRGDQPLKTVWRVPYSYGGRDSYDVDGHVRPGWVDRNDARADACVVMNGPGSKPQPFCTGNNKETA